MEQWKLYCVVEPCAGASIHGDPFLHLLITKNQKKDDGCRIEKVLLRLEFRALASRRLGLHGSKNARRYLEAPLWYSLVSCWQLHNLVYITKPKP